MDDFNASPPPERETAAPPAEPGDAAAAAEAEAGGPEEEGQGPADYSFPDDFAVDPERLGRFQALAERHGISAEAAQAFLDLFVDNQVGLNKSERDRQIAEVQDWETRTRSDSLVGGPDFERKLAVARSALDRFGDPGLRDFLDATGAGSHPDVVRWMYRVGQATADDRFIPPGGGAAPASPEARARRFYDKTYKD